MKKTRYQILKPLISRTPSVKNLTVLTAQHFASALRPGSSATKDWDFLWVGGECIGRTRMADAKPNQPSIRSSNDRHYHGFGNLEPEVNQTSGRYESQATVPIIN
ncbi:hypothetical protein [Oscillatoria sp. FACHB-1406]|uniref:hypothetical protein n=1 Tax=Oscillatoria sp. FACHB-1406 TaxID=2692846 RepID=UPI001686AB2D|nr:hypothetical protein [Oscillatoria sp. FACHB-1406]MBD2576856.1 hypothetical protein [Oscillatoria sp. FACHB-1406]